MILKKKIALFPSFAGDSKVVKRIFKKFKSRKDAKK